MDRKRLGNVQQTDLTESRINDDFLYWLKTSGPNWLLAVMVVACLVMGWNWWKNRSAQARDLAWSELNSADIPSTLKDVALKHADVDSVPTFALLNAGDRYLQSVLTGKRFDREATATDADMTPELRTEWLAEADTLYTDVIKAAQVNSAGSMRGFEVSALFGRAAVAEARGDVAAAKENLEAAQKVAGNYYPWLEANAKARLESLSMISKPYPIPPAPVVALPPAVSTGTGLPAGEVDPLKMLLGSDAPTAAQPAPAPAPAPGAPESPK